jgi:hypothetical protein
LSVALVLAVRATAREQESSAHVWQQRRSVHLTTLISPPRTAFVQSTRSVSHVVSVASSAQREVSVVIIVQREQSVASAVASVQSVALTAQSVVSVLSVALTVMTTVAQRVGVVQPLRSVTTTAVVALSVALHLSAMRSLAHIQSITLTV